MNKEDLVCIYIYTHMYVYICVCVYMMEYYSAIKIMKSCHCDNMDGPWGHYVKWDKEVKYKYRTILLICGNYKNKNKLVENSGCQIQGMGEG